MMQLNFIKCHGSGNDFLLLDEYTAPIELSEDDRAKMAAALCDRNTGIGADGILFFQKSDRADGKMRVFNADGSEASMCGNGLRCVVRYASELLSVPKMTIETMKAVLSCETTEEIHPGIPAYKVEISPVLFNAGDIGMNIGKDTLLNEKVPMFSDDLHFTAVAVPNPHLIAIVEGAVLETDTQEKLASSLNGENPYFPDGVNVSFVHPLEEKTIFVRTFERGVGFTDACGTAMSASALVTCLQGINDFDEEITVYNPGGKVKCAVEKSGDSYKIALIGNATFERKLAVQWKGTEYKLVSKEEFPEEIRAYSEMKDEAGKYLQSSIG